MEGRLCSGSLRQIFWPKGSRFRMPSHYIPRQKAGRVMPGEVYPQTLADLTRFPKPYLRKVYLDPIGHGEWEYVRAPTGGIMGVRSKSREKPFRQRDFPLAVRHFEGRPTYRDWVFQHPSPSSAPIVQQGTVPSSPSSAPVAPQGLCLLLQHHHQWKSSHWVPDGRVR